jgi:beta-aspartyl-peptidase (threonine type)
LKKGGRLKKLILLLVILSPVILITYCCELAPDIQKVENEIQSILNQQKISWNEQNIEGFMEYYWNSEKFTFQSGNKRLHGWEALLSRYKESYSEEKWGKLGFTDIEIKVLSDDIAYTLGRWQLLFKDSSEEGLFTIIFLRMPEGWRIVHDHTS